MSSKRIKTNVIIVGAGPAGAGTSFFLSKYGIPHIVIEKETFPRDKVCGDACSGKTAMVINRANKDWMSEILAYKQSFLPSWGITFVAPNGKPLDIPFNPKRTPESKAPGFIAPRLVLDQFLFDKMDSPHCVAYQDAHITNIERKDGMVTVDMQWRGENYALTAPIIVGADGDKSVVRKKFMGEHASPKSYAVGLRAYYEGVSDLDADGFIELHFLKEMLPGYLWIFPLPGGMANVGVGIASETIRQKKINLRAQMLSAIKNNPQIAPRFANATLMGKIQGWGLPMTTERQPLSGDNYILTGDAASLVDPFSGEGIGNALYSGMLAADGIERALSKQKFSAEFLKSAYDDVLFKRIGDEFKISATLQRLCRYPWIFNFVVNKAYKSKSLRDTISCMFSDIDLREQLRKPSFYFKILLNR